VTGEWDRWNGQVVEPSPYADTETYRIGADWLRDCDRVEDWGCGRGWLRTLVDADRYFGIDGSASPHADLHADLTCYLSRTSGLFMRHVLEHNYDWALILDNAVASFTERMALILFTPLVDRTLPIAVNPDIGVPDIAFAEKDLLPHFDGTLVERLDLTTSAQYGVETVYLLERP
jgi:hypothetical protein